MWLKDITGTWLPASPVSLSQPLKMDLGVTVSQWIKGFRPDSSLPAQSLPWSLCGSWERQTDNADTPVGTSSVSGLHIFIHSLSGG